jgi:hypothetical protein
MRDVIEMARESHLDVYGLGKDHLAFVDALQRFVVLVRKDELEACAKVCEKIGNYDKNVDEYYSDIYAAAIRARGQA